MPVNALLMVWPLLVLALAGALVARLCGLRPLLRLVCAAAMMALSLLPLQPATAAQALLALTGPGSAAALVLVGLTLRMVIAGTPQPPPSTPLLIAIVALGLLLLPATAGLTEADPFEWGYRGAWLPLGMAALVAAGWWVRAADLCAWIALAALFHSLSVYGTSNLWIYLIDPIAVVAAAASLLARWLACRFGRQSALRPNSEPMPKTMSGSSSRAAPDG